MSSSTRVALALGQYMVNLEKMTPAELLQLLREVIKRCQSLDQFPGFTSINQLSVWRDDSDVYKARPEQVVLRLLQGGMEVFSLVKMNEDCSKEPFQGSPTAFLVKQELLLIDKAGGFILWERKFGALWPTRELFVASSKFSRLSETHVQELMTYAIAIECIDSLRTATRDELKRRLFQLSELQELGFEFGRLTRNISLGAEGIGSEPRDLSS